MDDGEGDEAAGEAMTSGYPTSAVAVFEYDGDWSEARSGFRPPHRVPPRADASASRVHSRVR